jgi:hypothetical protein
MRQLGAFVLSLAAAGRSAHGRLPRRTRTPQPPSTPLRRPTSTRTATPVWPRVIEDSGRTFTIYQPQIDKFDDTVLEARAAVQVDTPVGEKTQTTYGVIWIRANAFIDKETELVQLDDIQITKASFPTAGDRMDEYLDVLRRNAEKGRTVSLDAIEANLAVTQAEAKGNAVPLKNDPPRIYYRTSPALLVLIDGDPVLRPVEGSSLRRVINTKSLIVEDSGRFYMPIGQTWLGAPAATGPWALAASAPAAAQALRDSLAKDESSSVDLIEEPGEEISALLSSGRAPEMIVSTSPAELILTRGKPEMKPISGTQLLYVSNTSGDIFLDLTSQLYYVALTGGGSGRSRSRAGPGSSWPATTCRRTSRGSRRRTRRRASSRRSPARPRRRKPRSRTASRRPRRSTARRRSSSRNTTASPASTTCRTRRCSTRSTRRLRSSA